MYGYYDEQREAWIEVNEETQEATVKAYNETGEEILNQTFPIRKHGGQRKGAGRKAAGTTYQEGYNAGYQAGKRSKRQPETGAEVLAYEAGQKLRKEYTLANVELEKAAEHYALDYCGEPAGRSSIRYDAYEQFFRCKDWFKAGYNND